LFYINDLRQVQFPSTGVRETNAAFCRPVTLGGRSSPQKTRGGPVSPAAVLVADN